MNVLDKKYKNRGLMRVACSLLMVLAMSATAYAQVRLSADCTTGTANLTGVTAANQPANTILTLHSGTPATTANRITDVSALAPGIYSAAFFSAASNCYSSSTLTVTVTTALCLDNICPATTVNLSTAVTATNLPQGTVVSWHTSLPATAANRIANPTAIATSGTYFAAFYSAASNCFSGLNGNGNAGTEVIVNIRSCNVDTDGDGIADATDLDDDNDGILDTTEDAQLSADTDGDGVPNRLDLDSDNDGINDVREANGTDANSDGIADGVVGTTGIPSSAGAGLTPPDTDGDTRPNPYDLDSDNDGINDLVESGNPLLADANGDGQVDGTDPDNDGIRGPADAVPATRGDANDPAPVNTDGATTPDYTDLDSDNDGLTDLAESGIPNPATLDLNGDGKIDNPADADGDGIPQVVDGAPSVFGDANNPALPDTDNDGLPNYIDASAPAADLFPNYTFSNTTFNVGDSRDVIININEILGNATTGQIQFFVPFSSGFTYTFSPTQSTSTVLTPQTVNNAAWNVTNTGTGFLFTSTQVIAGNGRSRIAINVKADVRGTDANITTNIVPSSGGETNGLNNIAVLAQSIQN